MANFMEKDMNYGNPAIPQPPRGAYSPQPSIPMPVDADEALTKVMGRPSDGASAKLATWQTYVPVVVASLIACSSLISAGFYLGIRIHHPPTNGWQSFMYSILIGIPVIQGFAAIRYLYTGSTTCRFVLSIFLGLGLLGTVALAAIGGLQAAIFPFIINISMLIGLYLPGADLYAPGGTVKMGVVHGVGIPFMSLGALIGLLLGVGIVALGSVESDAAKLDRDSDRMLTQLFSWGEDAEPMKASPALSQHKDEVMEQLLQMEKDAQYYYQCGEKAHSVRAFARIRYAYLYMAWIFECQPQILKDRCNEMFKAQTRIDENSKAHPEIHDEAFDQQVEDALLMVKRMSISV